jgi:hypothetical protein
LWSPRTQCPGPRPLSLSRGSMRRTPPRRHCDRHRPAASFADERFSEKRASGSRSRRVVRRLRYRPNSVARVRGTAPPARRSHSSRASVTTGSEPTIPMATKGSSVSDPFGVGAGDRFCPRPALGRWAGRRLLRTRFRASGERSRDCSLSSKAVAALHRRCFTYGEGASITPRSRSRAMTLLSPSMSPICR